MDQTFNLYEYQLFHVDNEGNHSLRSLPITNTTIRVHIVPSECSLVAAQEIIERSLVTESEKRGVKIGSENNFITFLILSQKGKLPSTAKL